ncbi:MAG: FHA domain-containing protein [Planctomycetia bacterium]|nr:FHA domain-containing protein [Planctomycetia bacterium]
MGANLTPKAGGSPISIDKPIILIGRNDSCDISLASSAKVSRRHCCIVQCGDKYLLRDLGSMNGVRVNTHRVVEMELQQGDTIAVADVSFTFRRDDGGRKGPTGAREKMPAPVTAPPGADDSHEDVPVAMPDADLEKSSNTFGDEGDEDLPRGEIRLKDDSHTGKFVPAGY